MAIYEVLQSIMDDHGLSIADVARVCNLPDSTVRGIINRKQKTVALEVAFKLSNGLGVSLEQLNGMPEPQMKRSSALSSGSERHAQKCDCADTSFLVSSPEREIIKKYRTLDGHGKKVVDTILQLEVDRPVEPVVEQPKAKKRKDGFTEIPVWDQPAAAGIGNYLDEPAHHMEQIPSNLFPSGAEFGIRISGDSMEPVIHDGQTVFVRPCLTVDSGKVGIFVLNGAALCKQLQVDQTEKQIRLVSLNKSYLDIVIGEQDELRTVGQVVGAL